MTTVVFIGSGRGLRIEVHHGNQSNKNKPAMYKPLYAYITVIVIKNSCAIVTIQSASVIKVGVAYVNVQVLRF